MIKYILSIFLILLLIILVFKDELTGYRNSYIKHQKDLIESRKKVRNIIPDTYAQIIDYTVKNAVSTRGYSQSGVVAGWSGFLFFHEAKVIQVHYSVMNYKAVEDGDVKNLILENNCGLQRNMCSGYHDISFSGRWLSRDAGDGNLIISFYGDSEVHIHIIGDGNWFHRVEYTLRSIKPIHDILKKASMEIEHIKEVSGEIEINDNINNFDTIISNYIGSYEHMATDRPPVPVEVPNDEIIDDAELNLDASLDLDMALDLPPPPAARKVVEDEEPEIFLVVDQDPELIGGLEGLQRSIRYPEIARKAGIEGRVFVQFVVDENGNVLDPVVTRGIGGGCDEAALEAVRNAKFKPGKQRGLAVKVQYSLPLTFRLQN
jgi:TonB family protein